MFAGSWRPVFRQSFAVGPDNKVMGGVNRDGKKDVKLIGDVKSDKQTPLRRRRDLRRSTSHHQDIFFTNNKNHHIPSCSRTKHTMLSQRA
jgi:hypothetical protein